MIVTGEPLHISVTFNMEGNNANYGIKVLLGSTVVTQEPVQLNNQGSGQFNIQEAAATYEVQITRQSDNRLFDFPNVVVTP